MVIHSSYTSGSLLGPEWKHVQEWPMPRPPTASSSAHIHSNNAQAGPSNPRGRGGTQGQGDRERDMVDDMGRMDVNALSREDEEDEQWEYETEEEEMYVTMDLGATFDPTLLAANDECQLIGLDTPTPLLKIGNKIFVGAAQWLIGSEMIFRDDRDPIDPVKHYHRPLTHTSHRLAFREVSLHAKDPLTGEIIKPKPSSSGVAGAGGPNKKGMRTAEEILEEIGIAGGDDEEMSGEDEEVQVLGERRVGPSRSYATTAAAGPSTLPDIKPIIPPIQASPSPLPDHEGEPDPNLDQDLTTIPSAIKAPTKPRVHRKKVHYALVDGQAVEVPAPIKTKSKGFPTLSKTGKRIGRPPATDPPKAAPAPSTVEESASPDQEQQQQGPLNPLLVRIKPGLKADGARKKGRQPGSKNRPLEVRLQEKKEKEARGGKRAAPRKPGILLRRDEGSVSASPSVDGMSPAGNEVEEDGDGGGGYAANGSGNGNAQAGPSRSMPMDDAPAFSDGEDDDLMRVDEIDE